MKLQHTCIFTFVLSIALALVFTGCAAPPPPTSTEDVQIMKNLQGVWIADSEKVSSTLKINGQEVTAYHKSATPELDKRNPVKMQRQGQGLDDNNYTVTYAIIDGKMVFRSPVTNKKLVFWLTGPDTMKGYRDDFPNNQWKMHRVLEK
jgi:hypothetical protein